MHHSILTGSHYEAGLHYGAAALKNGNSFNNPAMLRLTAEKTRFSEACIPICEKEYPELLDELRGIASGQNMAFEDLASFVFGIYNFPPDNGCTSFACRFGSIVIFGRNSDFLTALGPYDNYIYRLAGGYSFIANSTAMTQMEDGVNEHGLAAGLTFIYPVVKKPGLNAGILIRYILEKCKTVKEALEALKSLTISSSQTLVIADRSGDMALVECNACHMEVVRPEGDAAFVAAANDFQTPDMRRYQPELSDTIHSGERLRTVQTYFNSADPARYSAGAAMDLLSGKFGFMSQYDVRQGMDTVWSSVYDLSGRKVYRCEGNPSRQSFEEDTRLYSASV